ncbi:hypothetical protein EMCRGX_G015145 [Ephydatia muelleri]
MARWLRRAAPGGRSRISAPGWKPGTYCIQIAPQTALELVKYQHIICQLFAPDGSSLEPVPSRLTTTPAGTTPPYGAHGASHPQCRPGDLPAFELWQVQQEGRVLFYPEVLGPRLWWRALHQSLIMRCTGSPVISSEFTPLYDHELTPLYNQRAHTTLQPASSHHSTTSELTPLYNQRAHTTLQPASSHHPTTSGTHTTLRPASSHHSTTSELTPLYDQRAHTTLRPVSSHHSTTSELTPLYNQWNSRHSMTNELTPLYEQ